MDPDFRAGGSPGISVVHAPSRPAPADPAEAVTALYQEHALALTRMAHIMLGSRPAAEDVVQDSFCGLYRRWAHLDSQDKALAYVRSSVLNGCRSVLRSGNSLATGPVQLQPPSALSAEAIAVLSEERREVVKALWQLPVRQREVLVLRYYLDLSDEQIGRDLGMAQSSVRSARRRALAKLERSLRGTS